MQVPTNKMLAATLVLGFVVALVTAEMPSYIHACGRKNPNLDECVMNEVNNLHDKICEGMPELGIPPIQMHMLSRMEMINTDAIKINLDNVKIKGLCNFKVNSFHTDLEKGHFDINITFNKIVLNTTYIFNANIMTPFSLNGIALINADNVKAKVGMDFKKITKEDNQEYMYLSSIDLNLDIKDYNVKFISFNDTQLNQLQAISQEFVGRNQQEVMQLIKPNLEKVISDYVLRTSNELVKRATYDEFFPDRE